MAIGQAVMAFTGLPLLAVVWGFIGAVAGLVFTPPESKKMAFASVLVSGAVGAGGGFAAAAWIASGSSAAIIGACLIIGAIAKGAIGAAGQATVSKITKWGQQ